MRKRNLKRISIALIVLCHAGCGSRSFLDGSAAGRRGPQPTSDAENVERIEAYKRLIDDLERAGLFKHTDRELVAEAKAEAKRGGYIFAGSTERDYPIHPDELAEGGVKVFLREVAPFLKREGVELNDIEENLEAGGEYSITVNGERYVMYSGAELKSKEQQILTTRRTFALINTLLERARSGERIHLFRNGNETWAVFLTSELFEIISQSSLVHDENKPRLAE